MGLRRNPYVFLIGCLLSASLTFGQEFAVLPPVSEPNLNASNTAIASVVSFDSTQTSEPIVASLEQPETSSSASSIQQEDWDAVLQRLGKLEKASAQPKEDSNRWTLKLGGHVQLDYVNWANAGAAIPNAQDYFEFRRLRLVADGTGYQVFDFRLQMTLEPETIGETLPLGSVSTPDVKDAYLSMNEIPLLGRFRIGNFFVPFSLEQVTNDTNNIFLERSIPSQGIFAVDREVGFAFYNCNEDQNLTWSTGMFLDSISEGLKERIDDNQGYRLSGRVTALPYYDTASDGRYLWHVGAGVLYTADQNDAVRFRTRPHIREGPRLIDSGIVLADEYTSGNLESAVVWGAFAVQCEAFLSTIDRAAGAATIGGAYAHCSYFLTGENRNFEPFGQHGAQFGRNKPKSNFLLRRGRGCSSLGAWEAKARWSNLTLRDLDRGEYNDLTIGFNWYWNDRTRVMFDWIHPVTSSDTPFGQTTSDILASRFDFNW
jgi:phosphate-selective porin OprO/OprP